VTQVQNRQQISFDASLRADSRCDPLWQSKPNVKYSWMLVENVWPVRLAGNRKGVSYAGPVQLQEGSLADIKLFR